MRWMEAAPRRQACDGDDDGGDDVTRPVQSKVRVQPTYTKIPLPISDLPLSLQPSYSSAGGRSISQQVFLAIPKCVQLNLSHPSKWKSQWQNNCFVSSSSENVPNKGKTPVSRSKWIKTRNEGRRSGVTLSPPPFDSIPSICKQAAVGGQLGLQEKAIVTNDTATSIGRIDRANSI